MKLLTFFALFILLAMVIIIVAWFCAEHAVRRQKKIDAFEARLDRINTHIEVMGINKPASDYIRHELKELKKMACCDKEKLNVAACNFLRKFYGV